MYTRGEKKDERLGQGRSERQESGTAFNIVVILFVLVLLILGAGVSALYGQLEQFLRQVVG